ncbi:MAG: hypothetical protein AAF217_07530 [Pseudomonadota bacterium]
MAGRRKSAGGLLKHQPTELNKWAAGKLAALFLFYLFQLPALAVAQSSSPWTAGNYSFSDELGGFRILGVSGTGSQGDPVFIKQVFDTARSGTLVIRSSQMQDAVKHSFSSTSNGTLYLRIETINNTNLPWVGFGFELQEELNKSSIYGDGLSFDQLSRRSEDVFSNRFRNYEDEFEPGDRLVFTEGVVNNQTTVETNFVITDFTPVPIFYLYQDPLIPAS